MAASQVQQGNRTPAPEYYFTLAVMAPHPRAIPRVAPDDRWKPPKIRGNNRKGPATMYHHNGQITAPVDALPGSSQIYKQYSIYHDHAYIWAVPFDASLHKELPQSRSYAGLHLESQHLHIRRSTQTWPDQILPDPYRATRLTHSESHGGLNGELPLLIGLMALALPSTFVLTGLPSCIDNPWRVYPISEIARGAGWQHRRGLVVTVYFDPTPTTPTPTLTPRQVLQNYERGANGISILP
ncbi:hypothetical protein B0A55_07590 [Friedmanniomyces simplex]|uniref:Uncharacterized protein n=1 Tax=Friedmanniomyces simplex TaxID=329884 RepID=A0A4V5NFJ2_9PEZI|nr:hypothetical protein B0A55_07590 [Friedmanniomyces simplex]